MSAFLNSTAACAEQNYDCRKAPRKAAVREIIYRVRRSDRALFTAPALQHPVKERLKSQTDRRIKGGKGQEVVRKKEQKPSVCWFFQINAQKAPAAAKP
jgi:hypothetical protein